MAKLTNPLIDTIFKIIFGKEGVSEIFLIDFLNEVFHGDPELGDIVSVRYENPERIDGVNNKRIIYDIHCTTSTGHRFVVEMQRANQRHFLPRMFYYLSRLITDQVKKIKQENKKSLDATKKEEYGYMPVVGVFICNFKTESLPKKTLITSRFCDDETGKPISNLERMGIVQLPYFNKTIEECETGFDKWIYVLKNMERLDTLPFAEYKDQLFKRLEDVVRYESLTEEEQAQYDADLKWVMDYNETVSYQYDQGLAKGLDQGLARGLKEGRAQGEQLQAWKSAEKMYQAGLSIDMISEFTGLPKSELEKKLLK